MTTTTTFDSDRMIEVFGVKARLTHRTRKPGQAAPLWFKQRIVTERRPAGPDYPRGCTMYAEIRFDDECGNGHNSFAITGTVINPRRHADVEACGCMHDDIARVFPELAHLIKWHLCSTDSPMHYVANTVYHASDRDHNGKRKGEVISSETRLRFTGFPITFKVNRVLSDWLKERGQDIPDFETLVTPVPHGDAGKPGKYQFLPKYTFAGCRAVKWHEAPFDTARDAEEFAAALALGYEWVSIPTAFSEGKERNFAAARECGVWPDATDEQLSVEPEELKAALLERLPALIDAMRHDIESAGLFWSAEDYTAPVATA